MTATGTQQTVTAPTITVTTQPIAYNFTKTAKLYRDSAYNPTPKLNESMSGDRIHYTVRVVNTGTENLTSVVIKDRIPPYTIYIPGSAVIRRIASNTTIAPVNGTIIANVGTIKPGSNEWVELTFYLLVNTGVPAGSTIINKANMTGIQFALQVATAPTITVVATQ